jgi:hypothetical protein
MTDRSAFTAAQVHDNGGPLVQVRLGPSGLPAAARAAGRIAAPPERVWATITDVESYARHVPMMTRVRQQGERVTVDLGFKVALFSVGFHFVAELRRDDAGRTLALHGISGEPRDLRLSFVVEPFDGDPSATLLHTGGEFDPLSVGWLAKYFLKHHPEIQVGMFPGVALSLLGAMKKAAES